MQITETNHSDEYTGAMNVDATGMLHPPRDPGRAHWIIWELGLLVALGAIIATPAESDQQAALGILCLLFLMGLSNHRGKDMP